MSAAGQFDLFLNNQPKGSKCSLGFANFKMLLPVGSFKDASQFAFPA
jgi:hypothetical protein